MAKKPFWAKGLGYVFLSRELFSPYGKDRLVPPLVEYNISIQRMSLNEQPFTSILNL